MFSNWFNFSRFKINNHSRAFGKHGLCSNSLSTKGVCAQLFFLLFICATFTSTASAQQIRAYLSADSVRVGDRFSLTMVAEHTSVEEPIFPPIDAGEEFYGDLEVLSILGSGSKLAAETVAGTRIDSLIYEVTTFALDTAYVPSIPIFFVAGADTSFFASYPLEIPVVSLVPEEADGIRDLAPIAEFPINPWPWILGGLLLVGLLTLAYIFWKRRVEARKSMVIHVPEPEISPLEEAIGRLKALEKTANLQDLEKVKPFYVELTEILRVYLSRRLRINAMESTSYELIQDLKGMSSDDTIADEAVNLTKRILNVADLVKFADMHPASEVGHQAFRETREVLDHIEASFKPVVDEEVLDESTVLEEASPEEEALIGSEMSEEREDV